MMYSRLKTWVLMAYALGTIDAKPNTCTSQPQSSGAHCMIKALGRESAAAYCSSVLSVSAKIKPTTKTFTSTATNTVTEKVTQTASLATATGTPPLTDTILRTKTVNSTEVSTQTKTVIIGTVTSYIDTSTLTAISLSTVYTCGSGNSTTLPNSSNATTSRSRNQPPLGSVPISATHPHASASGSISRPPHTNVSVTAHRPPSTTSQATTCSDSAKEKRQTPAFVTPYCLKKFSKAHGNPGISEACGCLQDVQTPPPGETTVTITDPLNTVKSTSTVTVDGTVTITPTITTRNLTTSTRFYNSTTTLTQSTVRTVSATSTVTLIITSRTTTATPTPAQFNIYYVDPSSNVTDPPANFFSADTAPGGSGLVLSPEAAADSFSLNSLNLLVDITDGNKFITKNLDDLYPFLLLSTEAASKNTPICSACGGVLHCDYPGTQGNTFALCYGYLALGPKHVFGKDSDGDGVVNCEPITLQFK